MKTMRYYETRTWVNAWICYLEMHPDKVRQSGKSKGQRTITQFDFTKAAATECLGQINLRKREINHPLAALLRPISRKKAKHNGAVVKDTHYLIDPKELSIAALIESGTTTTGALLRGRCSAVVGGKRCNKKRSQCCLQCDPLTWWCNEHFPLGKDH